MFRLQNESESEAGAWLAGIKQSRVGEGGEPDMWIRLLSWGNYVIYLDRINDEYWSKKSSFELPFFITIFVGILLDYW